MRTIGTVLLIVPGMWCIGPAQTPAYAAQSRVLYQANFSRSFSSWRLPQGGWRASNGMAISNASGSFVAMAPYTPHAPHYAIEAVMKIGALRSSPAAAVALVSNYSDTQPNAGVYGGVARIAGYPTPRTQISTTSTETVLPQIVQVGSGWQRDNRFHAFRLEVQGTAHRELIDGNVVTGWVSLHGSFTKLGLSASHTKVRVKSFRVLALPAAHPAAVDPYPAAAIALTPAEANAPFRVAVFSDVDEFSIENRAAPATIKQGYLEGLTEEFLQPDSRDVSLALFEYRDAPSAQTAVSLYIKHWSGTVTGDGGTTGTAAGLGNDTLAATDTTQVSGKTWNVAFIWFAATKYVVRVEIDTVGPADMQAVQQLATLIYHRAGGRRLDT